MKYIKDIYKVYNPMFDNYGIKLYHVYEIKGIRFKLRYNKISFTFVEDFNKHLRFYEQNEVQHITELYRD